MILYNFCHKCGDYHFGDRAVLDDTIPPKVFCIICHKGMRRFVKLHYYENHREEIQEK